MPDQLESALVIALRDVIRWESATKSELPVVDPALPFDPLSYQGRDRALAFRDLLVGAAVIQASIQVSDVYNYETLKPSLQGPVPNTFNFYGTVAGNLNGQVRHVAQTSVPYDAARYADADLYGRDALVYQILARACSEAFSSNPVPTLDPAQGTIPDTSIWPLADGQEIRADVNAALPLNRDLFKNPDSNLADRDNELAGYVARMVKILKNPFLHALRLYVQTTLNGKVEREPDIYALTSDDGINRVFQTEPAISSANKIVYNVPSQTLQWFRESSDEVHVPQIYALAIPGVDPGQLVQTLPAVPGLQDAQFWRTKASLLLPYGEFRSNEFWLPTTSTTSTSGGFAQSSGISLPVPGRVAFSVPQLALGKKVVSALVKPCPRVEVPGQNNTSRITGSDGGATFPINVASGSIGTQLYMVEGGDGVVYNSSTYLPGSVLSGVSGLTTYTQVGVPSSVRLYALSYQFALPPGSWELDFDYADASGTSSSFGVLVQQTPIGSTPITVRSDVVPLPSGGPGVVRNSGKNSLDVESSDPFTLTFLWTYGAGQLHIRKVALTSKTTTGRFSLVATFQASSAEAAFTGQSYQAEVVRFPVEATVSAPSLFTVTSGSYAELPLQVLQLDVESTGTYDTSPLNQAFPAWRQECLDRALKAVRQGYANVVGSYVSSGSAVPTFRDSGSYWSRSASENWMSFVEIGNPRLREVKGVSQVFQGRQYVATSTSTYNGTTYAAGDKFYGVPGVTSFTGNVDQVGAFSVARPGHVGLPCLVPSGLYVELSGTHGVRAAWDTPLSYPILTTCQPWMVEYGLYTAQQEFWLPDTL